MQPSLSELDHFVRSFAPHATRSKLGPRKLGPPKSPQQNYKPIFARVLDQVLDQSELMRRRASAAIERLAHLAGHSLPQQRLLIENLESFTHFEIGAALLVEADLGSLDSPWDAEQAIQVAVGLTDRLDPNLYPAGLVSDLQSQSQRTIARCRRRRGDLGGAEHALAAAEVALRDGSGDPLEKISLETETAFLLLERGKAAAAAGKLARLQREVRRVGGKESADLLIALARSQRLQGLGSTALNYLDRARCAETLKTTETALRIGLEGVSICLASDYALAATALLRRLDPLRGQVHQRLALLAQRYELEVLQATQPNGPSRSADWARLARSCDAHGLPLGRAIAELRLGETLICQSKSQSARRAATRALAIFEAEGLESDAQRAQALIGSAESLHRISAADR